MIKDIDLSKITWEYKNYFMIKKIFEESNLRIYAMENFEHNYKLIDRFKENDYIFVTLGFNTVESDFLTARSVLNKLNPNKNPFHFCFLCNTIEQTIWSKKYDFNSILFNHNATINEDYFQIKNSEEQRIYSMVLNTRPEKWKRPHLAYKCRPLAVIKGYHFRKNDYYDLKELEPEYINEEYLKINQVEEIYNKSIVGGCFSAAEGACYSSSEMLLCGLPVISTESSGGRSYWYTNRNSLITEDNPESVSECLEICKFNLKNNLWSREEIRGIHILMSQTLKSNFINEVNKIFTENNIQCKGIEVLNKTNHKLTEIINSDSIDQIF